MNFRPYSPTITPPLSAEGTGVYPFLEQLTGYIFAIGIVLGLVSFFLALVLFIISAGDQRIHHRSKFWLLCGTVTIGISALIWAVYRLTQQFFDGNI